MAYRFTLSGGNASDISAQRLLDGAHIPSSRDWPCKRWLLVDKGYDAASLRQQCDRNHAACGLPVHKPKRRQRTAIEGLSGWPKDRCLIHAMQAGGKLRRDGRIGLLAAVSTTLLFVQRLV